jgi:hypothetical protein
MPDPAHVVAHVTPLYQWHVRVIASPVDDIVAGATTCRSGQVDCGFRASFGRGVLCSRRRLPTKSAKWSRYRVAECGEVATRGPALNLSCRRRPDASKEFSRTRHSDDFKTDPCRCSSHDKGLLASLRVADQGSVGKPEAFTLINGPHDPTRCDCRHERQLDRHDDGHAGGKRSIRWRYPKPGAAVHAPGPQCRPGGLEQHGRVATDIDAVAVNSKPADASRTEIPRDARLQIGQRQPSSAFSFSRQGGIIDDSKHQTHSCTVRASHHQAK